MNVILREAISTIRSMAGRTIVLVLGLALMYSAAGVLESLESYRTEQVFQNGLEQGADVIIVQGEFPQQLSSQTCQATQLVSGVKNAGGITLSRLLHFQTAPGIALKTAFVTPGYLQVISPNDSRPEQDQTVIGTGVTSSISVADGLPLKTLEGQELNITGVVDPSLRAAEQVRWVFSTQHQNYVDQCWIEAEPGARQDVISVARAYFQTDDTIVKVSTLKASDSISLLADWEKRVSSYAHIIAVVLGLSFVCLLLIPRRSEFALRMTLGFKKSQVVLQLVFEFIILNLIATGLSASWVWLIVTVLNTSSALSTLYFLRTLLMIFALTTVLFPLLSVIFVQGNLATSLRQR